MITRSTFFVLFSSVVVTKKSRDCFHSSNIISNVRSCSDGLRRKLKTKGDKVDACCSSIKSSSRLFFTLKVSLLETPQISVIIVRKKTFSFYQALGHLRPTSLRSLKFADSIFRILKSQRTISFWKISLIKQFKLIEPLCCEKYY